MTPTLWSTSPNTPSRSPPLTLPPGLRPLPITMTTIPGMIPCTAWSNPEPSAPPGTARTDALSWPQLQTHTQITSMKFSPHQTHKRAASVHQVTWALTYECRSPEDPEIFQLSGGDCRANSNQDLRLPLTSALAHTSTNCSSPPVTVCFRL